MAVWQDLVSDYGVRGGYQRVRRFAYKLRGAQVPPARAVILTAPGEDNGECRVIVRDTLEGRSALSITPTPTTLSFPHFTERKE